MNTLTNKQLINMLKIFNIKKINEENVNILVNLINCEKIFLDKNKLLFFLANIFHESYFLTKLEENLNYKTTERLKQVFPSFFKNKTDEYIKQYLNNPQKLANLVYSQRFGNSEENEGYKYRGRGLIMLTFKNNYKSFDKKTNNIFNITQNPDLLLNFEFAAKSAICYFKTINSISLLEARKGIVGSAFGLKEVEFIYNKIKNCI